LRGLNPVAGDSFVCGPPCSRSDRPGS
jgi:hypothetical protein